MYIGVIGSGNIGATAAEHFVDAGHQVGIANSHGPDSVAPLVDELGPNARAATVEEAAAFGKVVLEAIPFGAYETLPADDLARTVVVSAANYYPDRDGEIDFGGHTQAGLVAAHLADSRVVKAFNTMYYETLRDEARRRPRSMSDWCCFLPATTPTRWWRSRSCTARGRPPVIRRCLPLRRRA